MIVKFTAQQNAKFKHLGIKISKKRCIMKYNAKKDIWQMEIKDLEQRHNRLQEQVNQLAINNNDGDKRFKAQLNNLL